jgi:small-conductance mechanosensitive channel
MRRYTARALNKPDPQFLLLQHLAGREALSDLPVDSRLGGGKMNQNLIAWEQLENLAWHDVLVVLAILVLTRLLIVGVQWQLRRMAENASPSQRLTILRAEPLVRLLIRAAAVLVIVPLLVEPTFRNILVLGASFALALAYLLKDYGSSFVAGLLAVLENTYQPGDWIRVDGHYGEVKAIASRAVHLRTADDSEVIIPHSRLWSTSVVNSTSGNHSVLCVASFYLDPDHDASAVRERLKEAAASSDYHRPDSPVSVSVLERPWGTHYRVKAYVKESREQFLFISDMTIRGKDTLRKMNIRFAQAPYAESETG